MRRGEGMGWRNVVVTLHSREARVHQVVHQTTLRGMRGYFYPLHSSVHLRFPWRSSTLCFSPPRRAPLSIEAATLSPSPFGLRQPDKADLYSFDRREARSAYATTNFRFRKSTRKFDLRHWLSTYPANIQASRRPPSLYPFPVP